MILNNIEVDVKVKCVETGKTQSSLAETIGTTGQYVNRIVKKKDGLVNKTFVEMMEALGYDIELRYVKRENKEEPVVNTPTVEKQPAAEPARTGGKRIKLPKTPTIDLDALLKD